MKTKKKTQASLEYIIIFGIAFFILIIMAGLFFGYVNESKKKVDRKQIDKFAFELMSNIEKIYFQGAGNRITLSVSLPKGIKNFTIYNGTTPDGEDFNYINITFEDEKKEISTIYEPSDLSIKIGCSICYKDIINKVSYFNESEFSSGTKNIRIESKGSWVSVDFINDLS